MIILVKENPIVNRIALEGNKRLEDDDVLPEISIKVRDVFTKNKIQSNLQTIFSRASGRYAAIVEPKNILNKIELI